MSNVRRVYVEKKPAFAVRARELEAEIRNYLGISDVKGVRELIRYDMEHVSEETYRKALVTVFSEPPVDDVYEENFELNGARTFSVEFLPGQFDQRADSAEQCVKLVERRHHRVPDLRAILRLRREISGIQLVAHVFQRFIRMDAFQQRQNGLDGVVRRPCRLQAALELQKRLHHLLSALFQRPERRLRHALGIAKRLAHGLAAHIRPFAIRAEAIQRLLRQA